MREPITTARAENLLSWYDSHARELPWRIGPAESRSGIRPDPYRIWLSEVMLQQTTVRAVEAHFRRFTRRWPDVHKLAAAPRDEVLGAWAGLGYYARARNLHACAERIVQDHGGRFPDTEDALLTLPGIGPYTAAAIAAIAFDRRAIVVDGNVERVMARLHAEETPLPRAKPLLRDYAARLTPRARPGDYAQAVMDLGATICTPRRPDCPSCPWRGACLAHAQGLEAELPRRLRKPAKPVRHGIAWVAFDQEGKVLTERRANEGLLGGMLAVPCSDWIEAAPMRPARKEADGPGTNPACEPITPGTTAEAAPEAVQGRNPMPPLSGNWQSAGEVRHVFTHFHLQMEVRWLLAGKTGPDFQPRAEAIAAMPTVFAKAVRLALAAFETRKPAER